MATSNLTQNVTGVDDDKVKGSAGDATPGFLDAKVDATTITVVSDQLVRADLTGGVTTSGNAATVVTNANLTGDVTSVGNATTVVTNANLTGDVTSVGNATTIAASSVDVSMLSNGTDGELITWDSAGVVTTVPVGTATHVLTSNGVGAEPTFQVSTSGAGVSTTVLDISNEATWAATAVDPAYSTFFTGKYIKLAEHSTVTLYIRGKRSGGSGSPNYRGDIGGQTGIKAIEGDGQLWSTALAIDVSSLTNGVVYDIAHQGNNGVGGSGIEVSHIMGFAS